MKTTTTKNIVATKKPNNLFQHAFIGHIKESLRDMKQEKFSKVPSLRDLR